MICVLFVLYFKVIKSNIFEWQQRLYIRERLHSPIHCLCNAYLGCGIAQGSALDCPPPLKREVSYLVLRLNCYVNGKAAG